MSPTSNNLQDPNSTSETITHHHTIADNEAIICGEICP